MKRLVEIRTVSGDQAATKLITDEPDEWGLLTTTEVGGQLRHVMGRYRSMSPVPFTDELEAMTEVGSA